LSWSIRAHVAPAYGGGGGVDGLVLQVFDFRPAGAPPPLPAGLAEVLEEGSDFLLTAGPDGHLTYANRSARDVLGVQLLGGDVRLEDVFDAASLELYRDAVEARVVAEGSWQGELTLRTRQGRAVPVSARVVAHRAGGSVDTGPTAPRSISLFARDITEIKTAERKLRQLATHDYLTGLPNRLLLYDRLELALNRYARYGTPVALMFCDLDGFKPVNDVYGHQVGDAVLTEVADRIHSVVRDTDTAARLGGDEFAVLVEGVDDIDMLTVVAGRLVDAIARPVRVNGTTAQVGVSIGIVVASPRCQEPDAMVAAADSAMYRAKDEGRGRFHLWADDEEPIGGTGRGG
jgi:diguanylate cyclase (GGDEF)-like protein/PAS domain S-box-containing protein